MAKTLNMAQDNPQAYLWLTLAADKGVAPAEAALESLMAKMSADDLARGKALMDARQAQVQPAAGSGQDSSAARPSSPSRAQ